MIRKTVLVLAAGAAIVTAAAIASTQTSANSYGLSVGGAAYSSSYDFHKPAYSLGYRTYIVH
jgi:hypothetical protein